MRDPQDELAHLSEAGLLRQLKTPRPDSSTDPGQPVNFSSNDYLGLSHHPKLVGAAKEATDRYGTGATASRLVCGNQHYHEELEERIAHLKGTPRALTFANGFITAMGTITAIVGKGDTVILDKLSHACLIDAAKLSGATLRVFPHNNLTRLEEILKNTREKAKADTRILVVTESVFSMDGDLCPLKEIIALKERYQALLLLDEAHALGVLGPSGLGLADELKLQSHVDLQMGTLGKAAGSAGGYLAASTPFIELLINRARSLIYSTAPPPAQLAASSAALDIIPSEEGTKLRNRLHQNITLLSKTLAFAATSYPTPITPIIFGSNERALTASEKLAEHGYLVPAIRFPTVPQNTARLRVTLSAAHSHASILAFAKVLQPFFTSVDTRS
jgi:8-amino-7-oxononanoate synthase